MTVSSTQNFIEYIGDGATQTFTIPFYFILNSDIDVIVSDADGNLSNLIYGVDFSVSGAGNPDGGEAILNNAYQSGYDILIFRNPPETQETKYYENGKFPARSHEAALDKLTMLIQNFGWQFNALALSRPTFFSNYYDAKSRLISNLADPQKDQDAATKKWTINEITKAVEAGSIDMGLLADTSSDALGDALLGVRQPVQGAAARTQHYKNADILSILDFTGDDNLVRTGVVDVTAAFTLAMNSGRTVIVPSGITILISPSAALSGYLVVDGTLVINSTCTIGCDISVRSGAINVNSGFTVTITGDFSAPVRKIFYGSGTIIGIKEVWPEWWGAKYDTTLQLGYSDQIMAAYNCITGTQSFSRGVMHMNAYTVDKRINFNLTTKNSVYFVGGGNNLVGGRLKLTPTFSDSIVLQFLGAATSTDAIASFGVSDIAIEMTSGASALVAARFGDPSGFISGLAKNVVKNLTTHGFAFGIDVVNTRLISFVGCSTWKSTSGNSNGIRFFTGGSSSNAFVGDCDLTSCQFEPSGAGQCMQINVSIAGHQCKGISIDKTAFYKSDTGTQLGVSATNGGIIGDIFFSGSVQFDGFSNKFMSIIADGTGSVIDDVSFIGTYFRGSNTDSGFTISAINSGRVSCIRFSSCWVANGLSTVFSFSNCINFQLVNCHFYDTTGSTGNVISINGCSSFNVSGNTASRSGTSFFARLVLVSGASDYYVLSNNVGGGIPATAVVTDSGSGTHKTVTGNI